MQILSIYGEVTSGKFRTFEETNIRCGGFDFKLNLDAGKKMPSIIQILNDEFRVHLKDDLRQCNYCDKFGHRRRECRKRTQDLLQKATELDHLLSLEYHFIIFLTKCITGWFCTFTNFLVFWRLLSKLGIALPIFDVYNSQFCLKLYFVSRWRIDLEY